MIRLLANKPTSHYLLRRCVVKLTIGAGLGHCVKECLPQCRPLLSTSILLAVFQVNLGKLVPPFGPSFFPPPPVPRENIWGISGTRFLWPDALSVTRQAISKHWGKHKVPTPVSVLVLRLSISVHGWWRSTVVERRSVTGELSLSCARPAADGWPLMWVSHLLQVSQLGQLSLSSFLGR